MNRGTDQADLTTGNACWETPPTVFHKLNADFGPFDIDLTADAQRHLLPWWYGPGSPIHADALTATWFHKRGYSNPPYGDFVQRILPKAKAEAMQGFASTFLLPMRVTRAFKAHVLRGASDLLFCDSRIVFFENGEPRWNVKKLRDEGRYVPDPAMFDSIIVRYRAGVFSEPKLGIWEVPEHVAAAIARKVA